jgi:pimeloyl-ACP methyl ester carboxylesterase
MNVIINGLVISYQDIGDKNNKAVLFLHGWADEGSSFKEFTHPLADRYRCILIDLPGFGSSETPSEALEMADFSDTISKFLDKIRVKPYAIIGHSNGGAIAVNAVSSGKAKPKKLILLASSGIRSGQKVKKRVYKIMAKPANAALKILPAHKRDKLKKSIYGKIGSDYLIVEKMKETFKNIVSYDISSDAGRLKLPTLLIYGSSDTSTPPEMGNELHNLIQDSRLKIIGGAGHFVHQDKSREVAEYIEDFLK